MFYFRFFYILIPFTTLITLDFCMRLVGGLSAKLMSSRPIVLFCPTLGVGQ